MTRQELESAIAYKLLSPECESSTWLKDEDGNEYEDDILDEYKAARIILDYLVDQKLLKTELLTDDNEQP